MAVGRHTHVLAVIIFEWKIITAKKTLVQEGKIITAKTLSRLVWLSGEPPRREGPGGGHKDRRGRRGTSQGAGSHQARQKTKSHTTLGAHTENTEASARGHGSGGGPAPPSRPQPKHRCVWENIVMGSHAAQALPGPLGSRPGRGGGGARGIGGGSTAQASKRTTTLVADPLSLSFDPCSEKSWLF